MEGDPPTIVTSGIDPMRLATRTLLADRFGLVAHRETRELPIYEMVMARADKRLGANLQPATDECRAVRVPNGSPKPPPPRRPPLPFRRQ